ncbi:hypothetical protein M758_1G233600 [Ceratodon purpureus]|nr:hypothetical protein M758_1G233600 [Ceratodon purpureus]
MGAKESTMNYNTCFSLGTCQSPDDLEHYLSEEINELRLLEGGVQINKKQCANLLHKLSGSMEETIELIDSSRKDSLRWVLRDLSRIINKVKGFVKSNSTMTWLAAAINMKNEETFCELLLEMQICFSSVRNRASGGKYESDSLTFDPATVQDIMDDLNSFEEQIEQALHNYKEQASYLKNRLNCLRAAESGALDLSKYGWSLPSETRADLGGGAFGMVSEMKWMDQRYALKTFSSEDHFRKEASILARLNHPNIIKFLHYGSYQDGEGRDRHYIAMELGDEDLEKLMDRSSRNRTEPPFEYRVAFDILFQIARGMRYLHEKQVAHFDLKPSNILVTEMAGHFNVKIIDFFISESYGGSKEEKAVLSRGNLGTTKYMAPEVFGAAGKKVSPFKADVYSFAMTCYEILTGKVPFEGTLKHREIQELVRNGTRPKLKRESYPGDLVELIKKCWDTDPEKRPSFEGICLELRKVKVGYLINLNASSIKRDHHEELSRANSGLDGGTSKLKRFLSYKSKEEACSS